jgi:hypothetical protein
MLSVPGVAQPVFAAVFCGPKACCAFWKLEVSDRTEAATTAIQRGLISVDE